MQPEPYWHGASACDCGISSRGWFPGVLPVPRASDYASAGCCVFVWIKDFAEFVHLPPLPLGAMVRRECDFGFPNS